MMDVLLLSRDSQLIASIGSACAKHGISLTTCSTADEGGALMRRRKMYAVLVDDSDAFAAANLLSMRQRSQSSRNAVSIALLGISPHPLKATFVVPKPVSLEVALRTLRAAEGQMSSEFRRYFRHPLQAAVTVRTERSEQLQASAVNVSRSGLAVRFAEPRMLANNSLVRASFMPPTPDAICIELKGRVAWADEQGFAGFYICGVTPGDQKRLEEWLATLPADPRSQRGGGFV